MSPDTSPEAARVLTERTLRLTPAQRVAEGLRASLLARDFMRAGIRMRHPDYTRDQVEDALARLLWGDELYRLARPGRELPDP